MKKIIFILNLILVFQLFAEEKEEDYSKYLEFIKSDFDWEGVNRFSDIFEYEFNKCNRMLRITYLVKYRFDVKDEQALVNKLQEFHQKTTKQMAIDHYKNSPSGELVGQCLVDNEKFFLHKISGNTAVKWKIFQWIAYHSTDPANFTIFQSSVQFPWGKQKLEINQMRNYAERGEQAKIICKKTSRALDLEDIIQICRRQLNAN